MSDTRIPFSDGTLAATLHVPSGARGTVVFVHGSGVDRRDRRERHVARRLARAGFATVQPDLLAPWQALERHDAFSLELQCVRLLETLDWVGAQAWGRGRPLGLYGCGIGAAVVLLAAAKRPRAVQAVVCRDGRPDAALSWLPQVEAATLLIIDEADRAYVLAYERLGGPKELVAVPSDSHRFEEPPALEAVARHAAQWFSRHLEEGRVRAA
ncbi:MAG TPA: dienelactone hydrolase family protein [Burkholderiales bacterium]|nr:dienelactone hydrolase family protein [Burkholderiales bacterium]